MKDERTRWWDVPLTLVVEVGGSWLLWNYVGPWFGADLPPVAWKAWLWGSIALRTLLPDT